MQETLPNPFFHRKIYPHICARKTEKYLPLPVAVNTSTTQAQIQDSRDDESELADCPLLLKNECPHGLSGKKDGTCQFRHRQRCPKYMKWGDKHVNGCRVPSCPKLHPELCVRSLALECYDRNCHYKLHTKKCKRTFYKQRNDYEPVSRPQRRHQGGHSLYAGHRPTAQFNRNNRGRCHNRNQGQSEHSSRPAMPQVWQSQSNQNFQNLTVQPQLEAVMQVILQQQQELIKMAMEELVSQFRGGSMRDIVPQYSS